MPFFHAHSALQHRLKKLPEEISHQAWICACVQHGFYHGPDIPCEPFPRPELPPPRQRTRCSLHCGRRSNPRCGTAAQGTGQIQRFLSWPAASPRGPRALGPPEIGIKGQCPAKKVRARPAGLLLAVASEQRAESGSVYMVATPIGNLQDMTARAVSILRSVDFVVSEDTRRTGTLLQHFGISAKQISHHEHNWQQKAPEIVSMAQAGKSFAVVSDAGTPGISDPGMQLAQMCLTAGVTVRPVPGACAAAAVISVSGMGAGEFLFKGFLPAKGQERDRAIEQVCACPCAVVLYEAPHRVLATLKAIAVKAGGRGMLIGRELTKVHEEVYRGTVDEVIKRLEDQDGSIKGEFAIVLQEISPSGGGKGSSMEGEEQAKSMLSSLLGAGVSVSAAGKAVSAAMPGVPKNKIKKLSLALAQEGSPDSVPKSTKKSKQRVVEEKFYAEDEESSEDDDDAHEPIVSRIKGSVPPASEKKMSKKTDYFTKGKDEESSDDDDADESIVSKILTSNQKSKDATSAKEADEETKDGSRRDGDVFSVVGIDHIVLRAKDPAAMEAFYMRVLNSTLAKRNEAAQMSHLRIGDCLIDIVAEKEGSPAAGSAGGDPRNLDHFAISVTPFEPDKIRAHLKLLGLDPSEAKTRYGAYGDGKSIYFTDCEGNVVELKGRPGR